MLPNNNVNTEKSLKGCEQKRIEVQKLDWFEISFMRPVLFLLKFDLIPIKSIYWRSMTIMKMSKKTFWLKGLYRVGKQTLPSEGVLTCAITQIFQLLLGKNSDARTVLDSWSRADSKTVFASEFLLSISWDIEIEHQAKIPSEGNVCLPTLYMQNLDFWGLPDTKLY